ncbi:hypothetical protein [Actinomadura rudentiformis]|uniref:Uncharacterized protein n=1 Tax=Actinomadura rudentiformis TaxID=359158 RepID=A0A6H9YXM9_9ACTN|nr:hypothetical protein [Actinomadura rudentiformis]KAB2347354.1 hypothetical protein F8566_20290 [Actinomadura rudentiformis]
MADFADLIKNAKLPEDGVSICLRSDLALQHEELEGRLEAARTADQQNTLAAGGQARKIAEEIQALEEQMREHTHRFVFRGIPRRRYRDLMEQYPPREGNKDDALFGADNSTFPHALIAACCIDPVMTRDQVEELCEVLTDGQVLELFGCALALNRGLVDVPKSVAASAILAKPAPRSRQPEPGASAGDGSWAGSLAGPPATSTTRPAV